MKNKINLKKNAAYTFNKDGDILNKLHYKNRNMIKTQIHGTIDEQLKNQQEPHQNLGLSPCSQKYK